MDKLMDSFNVEAGVFLHHLRSFNDTKNAQIGKKTLAILMDIVTYIEMVAANKPHMDAPNETDLSFLHNLDRRQFELRQNIICRVCSEPVSISQVDFQDHLKKSSHVQQAQNCNWIQDISPKPTNDCSEVHPEKLCDKTNHEICSPQEDSGKSPIAKSGTSKSVQQEKVVKSYENENIFTKSWIYAKAKGAYDSDDSWEPSIRDFNFDSKYLIEVRGLPWSATKEDVKDFFHNVTILNGLNGIHFILEEKHLKNGRAFVQLEQYNDLVLALKFNRKSMDDRYVEVLSGDQYLFTDLVNKRKIPSKERVVFVEGFQSDFTEQNIRLVFTGLLIDGIRMVPTTTSAFIKFSTVGDVELALRKADKDSSMRIYRSTEQQMQSNCKKTKVLSLRPSRSSLHRVLTKNDPKLDKNDHNEIKFVKVQGLPWSIDESFVIDLFPGLSFDKTIRIKMDRDYRGRFTGVAFIAFNNPEDFEMALNSDLSAVNRHVRVTKAKEMELVAVQNAN